MNEAHSTTGEKKANLRLITIRNTANFVRLQQYVYEPPCTRTFGILSGDCGICGACSLESDAGGDDGALADAS